MFFIMHNIKVHTELIKNAHLKNQKLWNTGKITFAEIDKVMKSCCGSLEDEHK